MGHSPRGRKRCREHYPPSLQGNLIRGLRKDGASEVDLREHTNELWGLKEDYRRATRVDCVPSLPVSSIGDKSSVEAWDAPPSADVETEGKVGFSSDPSCHGLMSLLGTVWVGFPLEEACFRCTLKKFSLCRIWLGVMTVIDRSSGRFVMVALQILSRTCSLLCVLPVVSEECIRALYRHSHKWRRVLERGGRRHRCPAC